MRRIRWPRMTLLGRIALFLAAFAAAMVLQIGIGYYQTNYVLEPLKKRSESIQTVSQFLNDMEACMTALENYRWDYGDAASLIAEVRNGADQAAGHLERIDTDLRTVGEEQYLSDAAPDPGRYCLGAPGGQRGPGLRAVLRQRGALRNLPAPVHPAAFGTGLL